MPLAYQWPDTSPPKVSRSKHWRGTLCSLDQIVTDPPPLSVISYPFFVKNSRILILILILQSMDKFVSVDFLYNVKSSSLYIITIVREEKGYDPSRIQNIVDRKQPVTTAINSPFSTVSFRILILSEGLKRFKKRGRK